MHPDLLELCGSLGFLDEIAEQYAKDASSVDPSWV
jgi:hypothetical protein